MAIAMDPVTRNRAADPSSNINSSSESPNVAVGGRTEKPLLNTGKACHKFRIKRNNWPKARGVDVNAVEHPHGVDACPFSYSIQWKEKRAVFLSAWWFERQRRRLYLAVQIEGKSFSDVNSMSFNKTKLFAKVVQSWHAGKEC